jgi:spore maturation protein CgeB
MGFLNKYQNWSRRPNPSVYIHPKIAKSCNDPVYGADMYQLLRRSKLTFNAYTRIDANKGKVPYVAGNIRLFEATGVGTCILTQYTDDLASFFKPDEEVAVYRTSKEAISKAKYLLANDSERNRIASAGMKKTWENHTASIRAKQFVEIIEEYI